jgi:hypothetical protein
MTDQSGSCGRVFAGGERPEASYIQAAKHAVFFPSRAIEVPTALKSYHALERKSYSWERSPPLEEKFAQPQ